MVHRSTIIVMLALTGCLCSLQTALGHYYPTGFQNSNPFYQPLRYGYASPVVYNEKVKHQVPAFMPVSPTFQVEIMKPMAQLEEQTTVTLYIIPQSALHVFPHIQRTPIRISSHSHYPELTQLMGNPAHLPAVEIPLQSPMIVGAVESKVLAPAGFTVLFKGQFGESLPFPIHTGVLLAPVPAGTIISAETPVVLNTIYAVPSLPALPSYYPFLVDLPTKLIGPSKGTTLAPLPIVPSTQKITTTLIPTSPIASTTPGLEQSTIYLPSTTIPTPQSPALFQQDIPTDNELGGREPSVPEIISGTTTDPEADYRPFSNAKESPYLQELRDQSIQSLQAQISDLQRRLHQIRSN